MRLYHKLNLSKSGCNKYLNNVSNKIFSVFKYMMTLHNDIFTPPSIEIIFDWQQ